jgi:hypothetical protein
MPILLGEISAHSVPLGDRAPKKTMPKIDIKSSAEKQNRASCRSKGKASGTSTGAHNVQSMVGLETGYFPETKSSISR